MAPKVKARSPRAPKVQPDAAEAVADVKAQPKKVAAKTAVQKLAAKKKGTAAATPKQMVTVSIIGEKELEAEIKGMDAEQLEDIQDKRRVYSTGCPGLDAGIGKADPIHGNGGIPELSIVEAYGPTGSGKSLCSLHVARSILDDDPNNMVVFLLTEEPDMKIVADIIGAENRKRFKILGAYNPKHPDMKLQLAEDQLMNLIKAAKYKNVKMLCIDSIKALISADQVFDKGEVTKAKDKSFTIDEMAIRSRLMEKLFNRLMPNRNCAILWMINHLTQKIPTKQDRFIIGKDLRDETACGRLKEYMSLIRLKIDSESIKDESGRHTINNQFPIIGKRLVITIKKNRHGFDGRKVMSDYIYGYGFNAAKEVFTWGRYIGAFPRDGNWYQFKEERVNGEKAAILYLYDHPEEVDEIAKIMVKDHVKMFKLQPGQTKTADKAKAKIQIQVEDDDED